jgi:hypothetical protein
MAKGVAYVRFLDLRLSHPNAKEAGFPLHAHALVVKNGVRHQFAEFAGACLVPMQLPELTVVMGPIDSGQDIDVAWQLTLCAGCAGVCKAEVSSVELGITPR